MADKELCLEQCSQQLSLGNWICHFCQTSIFLPVPDLISPGNAQNRGLEPISVPQASLAKNWVSQGNDQTWSWRPQGNTAGYTHTNTFSICSLCNITENIILKYAKWYDATWGRRIYQPLLLKGNIPWGQGMLLRTFLCHFKSTWYWLSSEPGLDRP